jgi:hypothetical protein
LLVSRCFLAGTVTAGTPGGANRWARDRQVLHSEPPNPDERPLADSSFPKARFTFPANDEKTPGVDSECFDARGPAAGGSF